MGESTWANPISTSIAFIFHLYSIINAIEVQFWDSRCQSMWHFPAIGFRLIWCKALLFCSSYITCAYITCPHIYHMPPPSYITCAYITCPMRIYHMPRDPVLRRRGSCTSAPRINYPFIDRKCRLF